MGALGVLPPDKKKKEFRHQMKHSGAYAYLDYKLSSPTHKVLSINTLREVDRKWGGMCTPVIVV